MVTYEIVAPITIESSYSVTGEVIRAPFVVADFTESWDAVVLHRVATPLLRADMVEAWQSSVNGSWVRGTRAELHEQYSGTGMSYNQAITLSNITGTFACHLTARIGNLDTAMSLSSVAREIYSLWGYEITDLRVLTYGRESIVNWCNAAMQLIYSNAHRLDYFNRETLELTVTTSGTVALPANVQMIQGPARIGTAPLRTLASRSEYDHFAALYVGDSTVASPIAFYVEPIRGSLNDSVGLTLNLTPLPADTVTVRLDVTLEPPRYDTVDLMQATLLQLPHKWAETIFLPLARKWACADARMGNTRRAAVMPQIDEQFALARQMLGLADIEPPAQAKAKPEKEVAKP